MNTLSAVDDRVAFEVEFLDMRCVTFAKSAAAAKCNAVLSAREAGYCHGTWPTCSVARRPELDNHFLKDDDDKRRCWSEDYLRFGPREEI